MVVPSHSYHLQGSLGSLTVLGCYRDGVQKLGYQLTMHIPWYYGISWYQMKYIFIVVSADLDILGMYHGNQMTRWLGSSKNSYDGASNCEALH
jgi:hypothetical protein